MADSGPRAARTSWLLLAGTVLALGFCAWRVLQPAGSPSRRAEAAQRSAGPTATTEAQARAALRASPLEGRSYRLLADSALAEVGSSRVDLQACKLEYSIVSPK